MNINGIGPRLAAQGRKAMFNSNIRFGKEQAAIGETYLKSIREQSDVRDEQVVAQTARQAWSGVQQWRGQVAVADAALGAIAGGIAGPLGATLAAVGNSAMFSPHISTIRDQAIVGLEFTRAVRDYSTDDAQRAAADVALKSAAAVSTIHAQFGIVNSFLSAQLPNGSLAPAAA